MVSSASEPAAFSAGAAADSRAANRAGPRPPTVGLTTYMQPAAWGVWDTEAAVLPAEYVRMVVSAGATPVLLPPYGTEESVLDSLDGLVLTGGADVGPDRYGQAPHPETKDQPWRDEHEFTLLAAARERAMPVLGICRGMQVVNSACGGTLHQHVPDVLGHSDYQPEPGVYGQMIARTEPGSRIADIVGEAVTAPCYHHQSVDRVGDGLTVTARTEDGTIEVLEGLPDEPWLLAVQWHPEHNPADVRVVTAFAEAARGYAERRTHRGAGRHAGRATDSAAQDPTPRPAPGSTPRPDRAATAASMIAAARVSGSDSAPLPERASTGVRENHSAEEEGDIR